MYRVKIQIHFSLDFNEKQWVYILNQLLNENLRWNIDCL